MSNNTIRILRKALRLKYTQGAYISAKHSTDNKVTITFQSSQSVYASDQAEHENNFRSFTAFIANSGIEYKQLGRTFYIK